jgi:hypothetical protein
MKVSCHLIASHFKVTRELRITLPVVKLAG